MAESWINSLPDALMQEIYNIDRRVRQAKALKCDVQSDEDFVKTAISDPCRDLFEEHQDMKALCMTLSGGENLSETTMMDMTIDNGDSSKMDFTILSPDETQLHTKAYVNEALKDHFKTKTDAISMQQKRLAVLQKELDEYDELLEIEIKAAEEEEEDDDEDTITNEEESPDDEECCLYRDRIEEIGEQVETMLKNIVEEEESIVHLEEEWNNLKQSFNENKEQQCTLKNLIERLEEETVLMENQVRMQAHTKKNQREHLSQGNGLFAEYEDRRQIIIQKNEKMKLAKKEILLSKNKWDVKFRNLKKENMKLIDKLKDDKSWMTNLGNLSESKHTKLLTLFKTFEELINFKPLEYMEFSYTEEIDVEQQSLVAMVMNRSWRELEEIRNQVLQRFGKNISMIENIFSSKNKLIQINHLINMEKFETKGLTGEIEDLKSRQANEKKEEEVKTRVVTFNVQEDDEGKEKERVVEKKKPAFKWVKAKKVDLAAILNS